jgi:hypothetical protein
MGERGRRKAANYDWPIIARRLLELYVELQQKERDLSHVE